MPRHAVVLASRHAGAAGHLERARAAMIEDGFTILDEISITQHERLSHWVSGPVARLPLIVAAGGDGTVGTAASYVANTGAVLGVLPLGTSNDFARSLRIPTHPLRAARLLARGKIVTIDAGRLTVAGQPARYFIHAATAGLNVSFARLATQASLRRRFGRLTYAWLAPPRCASGILQPRAALQRAGRGPAAGAPGGHQRPGLRWFPGSASPRRQPR